ncbi:unnamed protein product [Urochloa humidicola]
MMIQQCSCIFCRYSTHQNFVERINLLFSFEIRCRQSCVESGRHFKSFVRSRPNRRRKYYQQYRLSRQADFSSILID